MDLERRLQEAGLELPSAPRPAADYVPWVRTGDLVHIAGQVPPRGPDGAFTFVGKVGETYTLEQAQVCARLVALNVLAQLNAACGGGEGRIALNHVRRVVKLNGFVNATPDFTQQPQVMNAASAVMVAVFGPEHGAHARSAVGVAGLPFGVAVEIDAVFWVDGAAIDAAEQEST
jgi:enamine deaminase RidA (YjgF/YER057c/UK114 family)